MIRRVKQRNKNFLELELSRDKEFPEFFKLLKATKDYTIQEKVDKVLPKEIVMHNNDFDQKHNTKMDMHFTLALTKQTALKQESFALDTHIDPCIALYKPVLANTFGSTDSGNRWGNNDAQECANMKDIYHLKNIQQEPMDIEIEVNLEEKPSLTVVHNIKPVITVKRTGELKHKDRLIVDNNWDITYVYNKLSKDVIGAVNDMCRTRKQSINNVLHKIWGEGIELNRYSNEYSWEMIKLLLRQAPSLASYESVIDVMGILSRISKEICGDEHQRKALGELLSFIRRQNTPVDGINLIGINIDIMEVTLHGPDTNEPTV